MNRPIVSPNCRTPWHIPIIHAQPTDTHQTTIKLFQIAKDRPGIKLNGNKRTAAPYFVISWPTVKYEYFGRGIEEPGLPGKLYEILEAEPSATSGIVWSADGDSICVFPQRFNECESKQHFQGTLYGSFTRRLYRYGFDRLVISASCKADYPNGAHAYRNDLFRRARPDLVEQMRVDNKRLYRKAIRQPKSVAGQKKTSRMRKALTDEKTAPHQNNEGTQELRIQNQMNAVLRNVNLDSFLISALSPPQNYENTSKVNVSGSKAIQGTAHASASQRASPSQCQIAAPRQELPNSAPTHPTHLDAHILDLLRLKYAR